jgi:putative ABC transport system permease protein
MNVQDIFWLSYKEMSEKKIRTFLTVMMVVIGVASIIALVSQTAGISASVQQSLSSLGPTSIIVTSTSTTGFTAYDTGALSSLPDVTTVIPILTGTVSVLAGNQNSSATLIGITPEGLQALLGNVSLYQGTVYQESVAPSALLGYSIAFPSTNDGRLAVTVGQPATLKIGGRGGTTLTVPIVGILNQYGSYVIPVDTGVIMSLTAAEELLHRSSFGTIIVKAKNTSTVNAVAAQITDIYGSKVRVLTTQQLIATASSIIGSITLLLGVIAGISLLVAAIGIMNVMLMSVLERTHEIGIMKSLGFKSKQILAIFLFQAMIIGVLGGIAGIVVGTGASYGLSTVLSHASASSTNSSTSSSSSSFRSGSGGSSAATFGGSTSTTSGSTTSPISSYSPVFSLMTLISALLVAVVVSVAAGIYPAWRASKMEPIDALRQL